MFNSISLNSIKNVFYPDNLTDVLKAIEFAFEKSLSITVKGGGSGLSGASTGGNEPKIIISTNRLDTIEKISVKEQYAIVQAGITPDQINKQLPLGVKFCISPSSRDIATIGGLISTDGGGNDSWIHGTMRDNLLGVEMILFNGTRIWVDKQGIRPLGETFDKSVIEDLKRAELSLDDIAGSHGTLGFISKAKISLKRKKQVPSVYERICFENLNSYGECIVHLIEQKAELTYSEAILEIHSDLADQPPFPILIVETNLDQTLELDKFGSVELTSKKEYENLTNFRKNLPKKNPSIGVQGAIFEGYGISSAVLPKLADVIDEINQLLTERGYTPFLKYGHAPSKWYDSNDKPTFGMIMHSREILTRRSKTELIDLIYDLVKLCEKLKITPKPEHKWPFQETQKRKRLRAFSKILQGYFNPFIVNYGLEGVKKLIS